MLFHIYTRLSKGLPISAFCEAFPHAEPWEGSHQPMGSLQCHHFLCTARRHWNEEANCTKIPIHGQVCIKCLQQKDNWNFTGSDLAEMLSRQLKEHWGRSGCTAAHGCIPPRHLYFPSGGSKSPFTSRNICSVAACMMLSLLLQRGFEWTQTDSISTNIQINKPWSAVSCNYNCVFI